MSLQLRQRTTVIIMSAMLIVGASVQANAQQSFTVTGPVSWAGQFDYNTWTGTNFYDGYFVAKVTHEPSTPLSFSVGGDFGSYSNYQAEWQGAISKIEVTVYDPGGQARFSETIVPSLAPPDPYGYSQNLNRVMKYASDYRNYFYNGGASTQQYWNLDNEDRASGLRNYGNISYWDIWYHAAGDINDFVARIADYPDVMEGAGWPNTHFSAYHEFSNVMKSVYGTISATAAQVDTDGDGINDDADACLASNLGATVTVAGAATKVPNTLLANGCTVSDLVALGIDIDRHHGGNVSTVAHILNGLVGQGFLSGKNKGALQSAVAKSKK
jgi:hypothetical protein